MTRDEQDIILLDVILACRQVLREQEGMSRADTRPHNLESFRTALRLDDPRLKELREEYGGPIPWSWQREEARA